ncbi:uncharacterized protein [Euwallacea similis]|uniref:uncharacterized protein n=1 Tax=Euwallacea similis TaxID=1736056 RepID=UPI00344E34EF
MMFKHQPIMCPWVSSQPYPSAELLKNKLDHLSKKHSANNSSKKPEHLSSTSYATLWKSSSSTHFFYFLRLMQLFPDTHPATLHTVLTLSGHNFFFAIDKLLYAQKCKIDLNRTLSGHGQTGGRRPSPYARPAPSGLRYQPLTKNMPTDPTGVQRIIGMTEKPCLRVQSGENEQVGVIDGQHMGNRVSQICLDAPARLGHETQTFIETENHEMIEIVCFDNDRSLLKQGQNIHEDSIDSETFDQDVENIVPTIGEGMSLGPMEDDSDPPVIIVDTMPDTDVTLDCINEETCGHYLPREDKAGDQSNVERSYISASRSVHKYPSTLNFLIENRTFDGFVSMETLTSLGITHKNVLMFFLVGANYVN